MSPQEEFSAYYTLLKKDKILNTLEKQLLLSEQECGSLTKLVNEFVMDSLKDHDEEIKRLLKKLDKCKSDKPNIIPNIPIRFDFFEVCVLGFMLDQTIKSLLETNTHSSDTLEHINVMKRTNNLLKYIKYTKAAPPKISKKPDTIKDTIWNKVKSVIKQLF